MGPNQCRGPDKRLAAGQTCFGQRVAVQELALSGYKMWAQLLSETETGAATIFSGDQQQRVKQIMLRVRGIECPVKDSPSAK